MNNNTLYSLRGVLGVFYLFKVTLQAKTHAAKIFSTIPASQPKHLIFLDIN